MTGIRREFPRQVREIEHCWVPLADGCRLAARIWLPVDAEAQPVPAILEYIPYRKRDTTAPGDALTHPYFAGHGYAAIRIDLRGSGDSDGLLRDEYLQQEQDDAVEVLTWIARQPWCTGAVGMIGISWGGFNAVQVAARRPSQLKAIITCCSTDDRYADDVHYMGGCLLLDGISWGSGLEAFLTRAPDPEISGPAWREKWLARLNHAALPLAEWLRHQRRDAYWRHGSVCEDYDRIACPVYAVGGWVDGYSNAILRLMQHLRVPRKALIGPWTHTYPHFGRPSPAIGFLQEALRWWDRWLKDIDNGIMNEPMLRIWMQENLRPSATDLRVDGRWVAEAAWPAATAIDRYYLTSGGLAKQQSAGYRVDIRSPQTVGLEAGEWCPLDSGGDGPEFQADQREDDGKSLVFDSPPLSERVEILGPPLLEIECSVDKPVALLAVRLCDVHPDGMSARVTYGVLNLTHRAGHAEPMPITPGERFQQRIALADTAYAFRPGHRIRVAISTTYWPMVWPSPEIATVSLAAGTARLLLPVRPARPADAELSPFPPPETAPPLKVTQLRPAESRRTIQRDLGTGETVLAHYEDRGIKRLDDIDLELGYVAHERYGIADADPLSARAEQDRTILYRRRDWQVRIETRLTLTSTKDSFRLNVGFDAFENDALVAKRRWDEVIPRDLL